MPKKTASTPTDTLALLGNWHQAAQGVVHHVEATRGPHAPYYYIDRSPWPVEAADILERDTQTVVENIKNRHALDVGIPLERIARAAMIWTGKRDAIVAFGMTKHTDTDAATAAARELERFSEAGLPEQRRLRLDLHIAEGAIWRASFPLLAERFGNERPYLIRSKLICWALWVSEAFSEVIREWSHPDEREILSRGKQNDGVCAGFLDSHERWELAEVITPKYIPHTDETPKKLAIEEARRVGDLAVSLPLIKRLDDEIGEFVLEAVHWPQGNVQPSRTLHLYHAVNELEDLVGAGTHDTARMMRAEPGDEATPQVHKATLAKAILFDRPDISPTELAKQVGVSRGTLYSKSKKWIDVRRTLVARDEGEALKGTKSRDGEVDAAADEREFHPTDDA